MHPFTNRSEAGRVLAPLLSTYAHRDDVVVLGLPRGGVPVAFEIAQYLGATLDVLIVRKLGAPLQPEFALGAIASGGVVVMNPHAHSWIDRAAIKQAIIDQRIEIERREKTYRSGRAPAIIYGRVAILVDDGAATGSSMLAAVRAARRLGAKEIVVAVPVASEDAYRSLRREASHVVCIKTPEGFAAVGQYYLDFGQTTDDEVIELLTRASAPKVASPQPRSQPSHQLR